MTPIHVWYSFPHTLGNPGIGTTALNQIRALAARDVRVRVFCTFAGQPLPACVSLNETLRLGGRRVPHRALGVERAYRLHDMLVARALRNAAERPDLVHAWPGACLSTFAAARTTHVVSVREAPSPHTASAFDRASQAAAEFGLEIPRKHSHRPDRKRLARELAEFDAADFVIAPSEYVVRTFVERGYPPGRLLQQRYGFDPSAFPVPDPRLSTRPFTVVFVGRGEPNKGLHYALRAYIDADLCNKARFLICGHVQPRYRAAIADLIHEARAEELGFVTDIGAMLRTSDALVLPTVTEGSALVVFEAMASGAIPIVSDAAGAPVRSGIDALVHPAGDVAALTADLAMLTSDPALIEKLRANALARRDELSWQSAGVTLLNAYRRALSAAQSRQ